MKTYDKDVHKICCRVCEIEANYRQRNLCEGVLTLPEITFARQRIAESRARAVLTYTANILGYVAVIVATIAILLSFLGFAGADAENLSSLMRLTTIFSMLAIAFCAFTMIRFEFGRNTANLDAIAYEIFHRRLDLCSKSESQ